MQPGGTAPKYQQIADDLAAQIISGHLKPGDLMPSEREIGTRYSVALMTARNALTELDRTGYTVAGRNRRIVAGRNQLTVHLARTADLAWGGESPTPGADAWVGDVRRAGHEPVQQIEVLTETAAGEVARWLEAAEGALVTTRRLIRHAGGIPHNLITFTFPRDIAQGTLLEEPASITEGSVAWLDRIHGPLTHKRRVAARMPTPPEQALLKVPTWVPVMVVWRTASTPARPVMCSMAVYPADRTELEV